MSELLAERMELFVRVFLISLVLNWLVWKFGWYAIHRPKQESASAITFGDVIGVFAVFIIMEAFVVPSLLIFWLAWESGSIAQINKIQISPYVQGWMNLATMALSYMAVFCYCMLRGRSKLRTIFWHTSTPVRRIHSFTKDSALGALTWFLSFPTVVAASQFIAIILLLLVPDHPIDQVAVRHLKMTMNYPLLYVTTAIAIVCIVPIFEEIIFRGFLQTWLVDSFGLKRGIGLTSLVFAFFHFSFSQGIQNIELITSLFILSCFLGFLYEKLGSLWASISLHVVFNGVSVLMLRVQELSK